MEAELAMSGNITPLGLLHLALDKESNIDVIERIARLQKEEREYQETIDFNAALSRCQARMTRIAADAENTHTRSRYATYAQLDRALRPIYSSEGFSISFGEDTSSTADVLVILGYLSRGGHTRVYRKTMPVDGAGAKGGSVMNKTHAAGSADSYAKRYLLKDIFNVAIGEDDDDGNGGVSAEGLHEKVVSDSVALIASAANDEQLKERFSEAFSVAEKQRDRNAMNLYTEARNKRRNELNEELIAWTSEFVIAKTVDEFNARIVPRMKERGTRFTALAAKTAIERGWRANKKTGLYEEAAK